MNTEFAAAMRRASQQTRAQNLAEATRLIQEALNGGPAAAGSGARSGPDDVENPARPRRPLAETLNALRRGRPDAFAGLPGMAPGRPSRAAPASPAGARFEARAFACAAGARSYKLYVPASAPERPRGLVVMLHGCTQDSDDFAAGSGMNAVAEARGFAVAYPQQTRSDNPSACWNWFERKDQRRGAGEPVIIAGLTEEVVAEFGIDRARVFVAGLSAGGAMAAVMGEAYPELYAAVGVHSGLPTHSASDVVSAFATMRGEGGSARPSGGGAPRTIVFQGAADRTVHPSNAGRLLDAATPDAATISTTQVAPRDGRRGYALTVVADPSGRTVAERWLVDGAGHAWSGGRPGGSYVDPSGPDASAEMMRFFLGEEAHA